MSWRASRRTGALRVLLAGALWLWAAAPSEAQETRKPNAFERAYVAMVLDLEDARLCAKISPRAETRAGFNSPGTQIYRERSRCYLYAAVQGGVPALCDEVVEAESWLLDGSYFSPQSCRKLVAAGQPFTFSLSFDRALVLMEMGYDDAAVSARFPRHSAEPQWHRFYLDAVKSRDGRFQARLQRLLDFSRD